MRRSMTYGVMPPYEEFEAAFNEAVGDGGTFPIRSGLTRLTLHGDWACRPLYDRIVAAVDEPGSEAVLDECSSIMSILGFEWI